MARKTKYFDMESLGEEVGFGKYEYNSLMWVIENDVDYLTWMYTQYGIKFSKTVSEFINEIIKRNGRYWDRSFMDIYSGGGDKERTRGEDEERAKEAKKEQSYSSGLDSKLNLLNAIANNAREQAAREEQYAQQEWLEFVVNYFDSCKMEDDTESGKLKWIVDEKKGSDVKRRIIYRADTKMGSILLMQESVLKEDEKWHMKFAFLSNDRKQKYMITKNNRGNIKNLRDQIKKQCP